MASTISKGTISGSVTVAGSTPTSVTREFGSDTLVQSANGYPIDHPFNKTGWQIFSCTTDGTVKSGTLMVNQDYTYTSYPSGAYTATKPAPTGPLTGATGARLFAATNPTRAAIKLPVSVFELRELPALYHQALSLLTRKRNSRFIRLLSERGVAEANLAIRFGIMPLFSDVTSLFLLPETIQRRKNELERLKSGKGLKRRINMGQASESFTPPTITVGGLYNSRFGVIAGIGERHSHSWGVATWKPSSDSPLSSIPDSIPEIRNMLLGMKTYQQVSNLWDALPWTWLIDYFSNVGDVLEANQGRHLVTPTSGVIMTTITETRTYSSKVVASMAAPADQRTVTFKGGQSVGHRYLRALASASVEAYVPTLSDGQLSILGSLLVTRAGRPR